MESLKAKIATIGRHRFEIDGKGIRTLVKFSGCSLRCKYCYYPYTWNDPSCGSDYTPEMLLQKVSVDSVYFQSTKGGITFGGGEPLLNSEFISNFIDVAPKTWNYFVETSLSVPFENVLRIVNKMEQFVVDIKSMDEKVYRAYTGGMLYLAVNNLKRLLGIVGSDRVTVRIPIIPNFADVDSQNESIEKLRILGVQNFDAFQYKILKKQE